MLDSFRFVLLRCSHQLRLALNFRSSRFGLLPIKVDVYHHSSLKVYLNSFEVVMVSPLSKSNLETLQIQNT